MGEDDYELGKKSGNWRKFSTFKKRVWKENPGFKGTYPEPDDRSRVYGLCLVACKIPAKGIALTPDQARGYLENRGINIPS